MWSVTRSLGLAAFALATNFSLMNATQHGLTIFYPITPSLAQTSNFSAGSFATAPPSYYECRPALDAFTTTAPSYSCSNSALAANAEPEAIYALGNPLPPCLTIGVSFEHFQWATWTHGCWARPVNPPNTPDGHAEAAFQSNAVAFREAVLYQHDKHVLTLNKKIQELVIPKKAEQHVMNLERQKRLDKIEEWFEEEKAKIPAHGGHHKSRSKKLNGERERKIGDVNAEADKAVAEREAQFWRDSYIHRATIVELDHLVGPYFERWMSGRVQEGWNWAGMGLPEPPYPDYLVTP